MPGRSRIKLSPRPGSLIGGSGDNVRQIAVQKRLRAGVNRARLAERQPNALFEMRDDFMGDGEAGNEIVLAHIAAGDHQFELDVVNEFLVFAGVVRRLS